MDISTNKDTSIKGWWKKKFTHLNKKTVPNTVDDHIFGMPLEHSLTLAKATIGYADDNIYYVGFVPIIVAKCGSFLKDQGLYTEGVFRVSGSAKRIGGLQQMFSTAPDYGRSLDWKGYSIHDAATVLRRFLNYLPEPVIIPQLYKSFKDTLNLQDGLAKIESYQYLIEQLPISNQYLLFYLLDLIALFALHSKANKMDPSNLAAVFATGILLDPDMALDLAEYKSSQYVVEYLIENNHHFKMPKSEWMAVPNLNSTPPPKPPPHNDRPEWSSAEKSIKRSNTVPTKRSKFGMNDPLQIIQLNKK